VARIIADLDKREQIETQPLAEAARCRGLDRSYWNLNYA
jgi:predicted ATPase with chaperone activity